MSLKQAVWIFHMFFKVAVGILCGVAWYLLLRQRLSHSIRFDWHYLTEMEELQIPIADFAFYMSYFYDVARAPSLAEGLWRLLEDGRSEAPDVVNALHKFNVLPEFSVAVVHRLLGISASPFAFYVSCLLICSGLGVTALSITAILLGRNALCGILAMSFYFGLCFSQSMSLGTRMHQSASLGLREHWGIPALLLQNAFLVGSLESVGSAYRVSMFGLCVCTCMFEASWQFAPFVLLLQMLSLLGAYSLSCVSCRRLGEIAASVATGTLGALLVSFGNRMLLCSPFFALAVSTAFVSLVSKRFFVSTSSGIGEKSMITSIAVVGGALSWQLLARLASEQEEAHVLQLLLQKLGLAPASPSFDAFLYLQDPQFGFLPIESVYEAHAVGVVVPAGLAILGFILVAIRRRILPWIRPSSGCDHSERTNERLAKGSRKHQSSFAQQHANSSHHQPCHFPWASWSAQLLFCIALVMLAFLVNRLRVLVAPFMCILGSISVSPVLWTEVFVRHWSIQLLAMVLASYLIMISFYSQGTFERALQVSEFQQDYDMRELVQWMNASLPQGSLLMADMTMTAKTRLICPHVSVGNHPQYESKSSRLKNRVYYRTFTCASPERIHDLLSQYNVSHVLLNANACKARIGKLDAFHEKPDQCGNVGTDELQRRTFCWGGFLASGPGLFELVFRNPVYTILRVVERKVASKSKSRNGANFMDRSVWKPWLSNLRGRAAARALARAGAAWPQKYSGWEVAELMQKHAEDMFRDDPIVMLSRGNLQKLQGDKSSAYQSMSDASKAAGATKALYRVYLAWKDLISERQDVTALRKLSKNLRPQLEASYNAWELCDIASWLKSWGEMPLAKKFWTAAKNATLNDACVREDWASWEGHEMTRMETWRLFFAMS